MHRARSEDGRTEGAGKKSGKSRKSWKSKKIWKSGTSGKRQQKVREPQRTKGRSFEEAG